MKLSKILEDVEVKKIYNYRNIEIDSITHISSDVIDRSIFIAIDGNNHNGNDYIDEAISKGAKCIITEKDKDIEEGIVIVVKNVRKTMSIVAKNFYDKCSDKLQIVGIVGTCGKTSTSIFISQIMSVYDKNIGVIGTNGIYIGNIKLENKFTTPDPLELHYIFYQMKMLGVKTVIMEISAQAISQFKMFGIKLKVGVFTNITREHLDFFGTFENYARCKMNYFTRDNMEECVVNIDDFFGMEIAYKSNLSCVSYGIKSPANSFALNIQSSLDNVKFVANILDDIYNVDVNIGGDYNVYNLLASITVAKLCGLTSSQVKKGLKNIKKIDGRFNVYNYNKAKIIIDFAHTPDSFEKILTNIKPYVSGKLIVLYGCVGYSDRAKRIEMSSIAETYSDYLILTTDNRGDTNFEDITKDMIEGLTTSNYICMEDRVSAINFGVGMLNKEDVLVILGKGAENFQMIGKNRIPYSDIEVVERIINKETM